MARSLIIFLLCLSSAYSEAKMFLKEDMMEKMDNMDMDSSKLKRDSFPYHHSTPCPPLFPHYNKGWAPEYPKYQYIHQPTYIKPAVVVKPHIPYHQPIYNNLWQPQYGHNNHGWSKPSYSGWQPKVIIQKPSYSYAPQYHKPVYPLNYHTNLIKPAVIHKPDCPPYPHGHGHTGIIYAPQHQYHHETPQIKYIHQEPQYVKVVKPAYVPPPIYHQPAPVYHKPIYHPPPPPVYHQPVHIPKVEICDH